MQAHIIPGVSLIILLCACALSALPSGHREEDMTHLVSLLGKLKNIERARQRQHNYNHQKQQQPPQFLTGVGLSSRHQSGFPISSSSSSSSSSAADATIKALASEIRAASDFPGSIASSSDVTDPLLLAVAAREAAAEEEDDDFEDDLDEVETKRSGSGRAAKRQGNWSYDYGLGGGRFGKRAGRYGDYGIGGGRFGRDVDHVDISDVSDADAASL